MFISITFYISALFEKAEVVEEDRKPRHLIIAVSSDRGLCGSTHSNVAKNIRSIMAVRGEDNSTQVVCVGDKIRTIMQRFFRRNVLMHFTDIGKKPPVFTEASFIAQEILKSGFDYESAEIIFNRFRLVLKITLTHVIIISVVILQKCNFIPYTKPTTGSIFQSLSIR